MNSKLRALCHPTERFNEAFKTKLSLEEDYKDAYNIQPFNRVPSTDLHRFKETRDKLRQHEQNQVENRIKIVEKLLREQKKEEKLKIDNLNVTERWKLLKRNVRIKSKHQQEKIPTEPSYVCGGSTTDSTVNSDVTLIIPPAPVPSAKVIDPKIVDSLKQVEAKSKEAIELKIAKKVSGKLADFPELQPMTTKTPIELDEEVVELTDLMEAWHKCKTIDEAQENLLAAIKAGMLENEDGIVVVPNIIEFKVI